MKREARSVTTLKHQTLKKSFSIKVSGRDSKAFDEPCHVCLASSLLYASTSQSKCSAPQSLCKNYKRGLPHRTKAHSIPNEGSFYPKRRFVLSQTKAHAIHNEGSFSLLNPYSAPFKLKVQFDFSPLVAHRFFYSKKSFSFNEVNCHIFGLDDVHFISFL